MYSANGSKIKIIGTAEVRWFTKAVTIYLSNWACSITITTQFSTLRRFLSANPAVL